MFVLIAMLTSLIAHTSCAMDLRKSMSIPLDLEQDYDRTIPARKPIHDRDDNTIHVFLRLKKDKYLELKGYLKQYMSSDEYTLSQIRPETPNPDSSERSRLHYVDN